MLEGSARGKFKDAFSVFNSSLELGELISTLPLAGAVGMGGPAGM